MWIHAASRNTTINTDGEEDTGQSRQRKGHWVTGFSPAAILSRPGSQQGALNCCYAVPNRFRAIRRHARCTVGKPGIFPDLKINASQLLFLWLLTTHACRNRDLGAVRLQPYLLIMHMDPGEDQGRLFVSCHSYASALFVTEQVNTT